MAFHRSHGSRVVLSHPMATAMISVALGVGAASLDSIKDSERSPLTMTSLQVVCISETLLKGTLPTAIRALIALEVWMMDKLPFLRGSIPEAVSTIAALQKFSLVHTRLEGSLPSSIGAWRALTYMALQNTSLEGAIPIAVSFLNSLQRFQLADGYGCSSKGSSPCAHLEGSLPDSIGAWVALRRFDIQCYKWIKGSLPESIGRWTSLQSFEFWLEFSLKVRASVPPPEICNMPNHIRSHRYGIILLESTCIVASKTITDRHLF